MCTDTPQRYLRRILVSDFKQTKRWPIIPSLRRCQCSPPPAYLSMCTDTPQRYLRRILILDFKQKNAGRPFSFQNRFSLLWQPCYKQFKHCPTNFLNVADLVLGSENRASSGGSLSFWMLYTTPHVARDAGHDGKSALKKSFFTFMIDAGIQAELDLLAIFAELAPTPGAPTPGAPPPLDPRAPVSLHEGSDLVTFHFSRSSAFHI